MRAVDTNVLVRLIARDDARQVAAAERFIAPGAWVSLLVLTESACVLDSVYGLDSRQIATVIEMLLDHDRLTLESADVVASALAQLRKSPVWGFRTASSSRSRAKQVTFLWAPSIDHSVSSRTPSGRRLADECCSGQEGPLGSEGR